MDRPLSTGELQLETWKYFQAGERIPPPRQPEMCDFCEIRKEDISLYGEYSSVNGDRWYHICNQCHTEAK